MISYHFSVRSSKSLYFWGNVFKIYMLFKGFLEVFRFFVCLDFGVKKTRDKITTKEEHPIGLRRE